MVYVCVGRSSFTSLSGRTVGGKRTCRHWRRERDAPQEPAGRMTAKTGRADPRGRRDAGSSYSAIIERIFLDRYKKGQNLVEFSRQDLIDTAHQLGVDLPKNIGDVVYSFRYRRDLPSAIAKTCSASDSWYIFPAGHAKYRFERRAANPLVPRTDLQQIKIPNATPEIIRKFALSDEQALLAIVRYNRLIDIFTGVTAYSLQNHLRTSVEGIGQIEVDELYIGVNTKGIHFVIPVQAKGRTDRLGIIQSGRMCPSARRSSLHLYLGRSACSSCRTAPSRCSNLLWRGRTSSSPRSGTIALCRRMK